MKLSISNTDGLIVTRRILGVAGLSVAVLLAQAEVPIYAGESIQSDKRGAAYGQKVPAELTARSLTDIEVYPNGDRITIAVAGDGPLYPEARLLDESRLVIDIPAVVPAVGKSVVPAEHRLLERIRVGRHVDKVRLVLDLRDHPQFSLVQKGADFLVVLKPGEDSDGNHDQVKAVV
ncbi:MAG: AMIN domain-containing protein, partial [Nitrospira sp.]|nr:AMIN domain-containing protein [Nitrospira sp.]